MTVEYTKSNEYDCWFANHYELIQSDEGVDLNDIFIPSGQAAIIFRFNGSVSVYNEIGTKLPVIFILPVIDHSTFIEINGSIDLFIVSCNASKLSKLFNIDMCNKNQFGFIQCNNTIFNDLWNLLKTEHNFPGRIKCFNDFILSKINKPYEEDAIDLLYDDIIRNSHNIPLQTMLEKTKINERTLRRLFAKRVGENAKTLHRIVRVNYFWSKIKNKEVISYQDIVFDSNYYDQSHFIKDFKSIVGEVPSAFFKRDMEIVKMISGLQ